MIVLTIDQQGSRREPDRVPGLLKDLRKIETLSGFERTVGDEIQGLVADARQAAAAIRVVLRRGDWHIGIGCGPVDDDVLADIRSGTIRTARGPAFIRAREAVEIAKKYPASVAVVGADESASDQAQALLQLIAVVVDGRNDAQREVVELLEHGMNGQEIAAALKISEPSVSRRRRLSNVAEEEAAWPVAIRLLSELDAILEG